MDVISQGSQGPPRRAGRRRAPPPRRVTGVLVAGATAAAVLVATGSLPGRSVHRPAPSPAPSQPAATADRGDPAVDQAAALLHRPTHFPLLQPGQACPVTPARALGSSGSVALGDGPVRALLRTGDARHGGARLASTSVRGWYTLDVVWLNRSTYQGPYVIQTGRLDAPAPAGLGVMAVSAGSGDTTQVPGFGAVNLDTWVRSPGCYAWQVDGVGFSRVIVIDARPPGEAPR